MLYVAASPVVRKRGLIRWKPLTDSMSDDSVGRGSPAQIRVLHVDDEPDFAELAATFIERLDDQLNVETTTNPSDALDRIRAEDVDCVVSDYDMPRQTGIEFLEAVREEFPDLPFILYTGKGSEEVASDAISAGVTDYLQKESGTDQYVVLANRIVNAVSATRNAQTARQSQHWLEQILKTVPTCVVRVDNDGQFLFANQRAEQVLGLKPTDVAHRSYNDPKWQITDLEGDEIPDEDLPFRQVRDSGEPIYGYRHMIEWPDGTRKTLLVNGEPLFDDEGQIESTVFALTDITEQREREQRYNAIFNQTYQFTGLLEPDGTLVEANESALEFGGLDRDEVVGKKMWDAYWFQHSEQTRDRAKEAVQRAAAGEFIRQELLVQGADGDVIIDFSVRPITNEQGEVRLLVPEGRDITDLIEREQELQNRTDQLQDIIDTVEGAMWIRNAENEYVFMNQYHRDLFDIADEVDVDGKQFADLLPAEVAAQFRKNDNRVYETGEAVAIEETVMIDDGTRDFLTRIVPLFRNGSIYATCGISTDVTEQKTRERKLDQFTSIVSHDLRNPLNVAMGRLELLSSECTSNHLKPIQRAHSRMAALIDDLLNLARAGADIAETTSVNLDSLVNGCWANVETASSTLVADIGRTVQADESRLKQLFENLIRNAIEHGGENVTVTIGALDDGFYIEDDGAGIPAEARSDIFKTGYSMATDSTGLGLSIVKQIVDAHDWSLRLTEGAADGTRFEITGVEFATE